MKIHIGCGERDFGSYWVHVDARAFSHVDHVLQDFDLGYLPGVCWDHNEVEMIYASHVLEYFDWEDGQRLCGQWHEKLRPGGVLRLSVPDWRQLILLYQKHECLSDIIGPLFGKMDVNEKPAYHKCVYDEARLRGTFVEAGFAPYNIRPWKWPPDISERYDDYSQAVKFGIPLSLNLEATK